jgi:hypothetical protein
MPSVAVQFPCLKKLTVVSRITICPLLLARGHIAIFQDETGLQN